MRSSLNEIENAMYNIYNIFLKVFIIKWLSAFVLSEVLELILKLCCLDGEL